MKMNLTSKVLGLGLTAVVFYVAGVAYGAIREKKTVSVYDLKRAIGVLVDDVQMLKAQVSVLMKDVLEVKKETERLRKMMSNPVQKTYEYKPKTAVTIKSRNNVRLSPWGKVLGSVPKNTKVIILGREGKWYLTNLGYMHHSLLKEVPDGN